MRGVFTSFMIGKLCFCRLSSFEPGLALISISLLLSRVLTKYNYTSVARINTTQSILMDETLASEISSASWFGLHCPLLIGALREIPKEKLDYLLLQVGLLRPLSIALSTRSMNH